MTAMTQLPVRLPEADGPANARQPNHEAPRTPRAAVARLPDWVFVPAASGPTEAAAPDRAEGARHGAELLLLPTQAPPYARTLLMAAGRSPARLPAAGPPPASRLDKHGIDLALSIGRHAVERAKLGGIDRLICRAPPRTVEPAASPRPRAPATGIAEALAAACPVTIALAGVCLAASQIGIRTRLTGDAAEQALHLARVINPDADRWVSAAEACAAPTSRHQASTPRIQCDLRAAPGAFVLSGVGANVEPDNSTAR